MITNKK